ncbi:DNA topoisomerase (ATP-hydrolyzing) NDAI_0H02370 [Naumovozyma dairenensis CBS 421]|uniref:DNA topoisomerase (ATP-hydrolyzing) n=1 Tax=Naumovozyma dairenensis (strain ATCC 10597 / BCRC 20456 / CBS 421 / NBRC 0211 / NRRL Y-12639) TaxID=1071378 RepID=G0WF50_NAUDC|nr:hypothetical protein NDAI_0H02370 [Naumovozyma dairenensis CBS 421]CCD26411.1 hypothetical protein NDAI_0H02370 [Naumovozyma dairenensis CBS 421]
MKTLSEYMSESCSKTGLISILQPDVREIHLGPVGSVTELPKTIDTIFSLFTNSIEQHIQPVVFKINNSRHLSCNEGSKKRILQFPYFGTKGKRINTTQIQAKKVACILTLLKTLRTRLQTGDISTIRDIFYSNMELYGRQQTIVYWLSILTEAFNLKSRDSLNVIAAQKGLIFSPVQITVTTTVEKGDKVVSESQVIQPFETVLIPYINDATVINIPSQQNIIKVLILEKEAVFNKIVSNYSTCCTNCNVKDILITGKGYPDFLTRNFINLFYKCCSSFIGQWHILTDADPHGVNIAYMYAKTIPRIDYMGIPLLELIRPNSKDASNSAQLLPLKQRDISLLLAMVQRVVTTENISKVFIRELQRQLFFHKKGEMNSIFSQ